MMAQTENAFKLVSDYLFSGFFARIERETARVLSAAERKAKYIQRLIVRRTVAALTFTVAGAFLTTALVLGMAALNVPLWITFLFVGLALLIAGSVVRRDPQVTA